MIGRTLTYQEIGSRPVTDKPTCNMFEKPTDNKLGLKIELPYVDLNIQDYIVYKDVKKKLRYLFDRCDLFVKVVNRTKDRDADFKKLADREDFILKNVMKLEFHNLQQMVEMAFPKDSVIGIKLLNHTYLSIKECYSKIDNVQNGLVF